MTVDFDLVIRNGLVATASGVAKCDVGIANGIIVALADRIENGATIIDANERIVTPGGVDTHCHIEEPPEGDAVAPGTFETDTASALAGGTTTVIPFVVQQPGLSMRQAFEDYQRKAARSRIDYGFHLIITDPRPNILEELPGLIREGNRSLKVFTTYELYRLTDEQVIAILAIAKQNEALVCVHAENDAAVRYLTGKLIGEGKTSAKYHAHSKPIEVEAETIRRVAMYAEMLNAPVQFFHVSGHAAAVEVAQARQRSALIFGETCTQYLVFTADDLARENREGEKFIFSPAARTKADQDALWTAIRTNVLNIISSDHAPFAHDQPNWRDKAGPRPFTKIPNGIPGLAARLPVLFSEGVSKGRISLEKFVEITCTNPARLYGLAPRKGTIAVGADADCVIWDADKRQVITNAMCHHANDYTPYEGLAVQGWPETTIAGGEIAFSHGKVHRPAGSGRYIGRGPFRPPH